MFVYITRNERENQLILNPSPESCDNSNHVIIQGIGDSERFCLINRFTRLNNIQKDKKFGFVRLGLDNTYLILMLFRPRNV